MTFSLIVFIIVKIFSALYIYIKCKFSVYICSVLLDLIDTLFCHGESYSSLLIDAEFQNKSLVPSMIAVTFASAKLMNLSGVR